MATDKVVATIYKDNGDGVQVSSDQLTDALTNYRDEIDKIFDDSYTLMEGDGSFYSIELHPGIDEIPIVSKDTQGEAIIKPGVYWVLKEAYEADNGNRIDGGLFLMDSKDCLISGNMGLVPVDIVYRDDEGEYEEVDAKHETKWAIRDGKDGAFILMPHIVEALTVAASLKLLADRLGVVADREEVIDTPRQDGRRPTRRYDPITKLHQNLSNPALYNELGVALNVAGKGERKKGKEVKTIVSLECISDDENVQMTRQLSEFDIQVYDAIASLYEAGKQEITLQEIFNMTMGEGKAKAQQLDTILESVELLRRTKLRADITQEAKAHGLIDPETGKPWEQMEIDDFLFSALRVTMKSANGKRTAGYRYNNMPIGLRYAKASKQIISYHVKYLNTKSAGSNTERNVVIRGYLLQRIAQAKSGKMPNTIRCEKIYKRAGINEQSRVERGRVNKYIIKLLDLWCDQGLIKSYDLVSDGQRKMDKIVVSFA